jgi:hypothetical protein
MHAKYPPRAMGSELDLVERGGREMAARRGRPDAPGEGEDPPDARWRFWLAWFDAMSGGR